MNNGEAYKRRVVTMDALNARNRHRKMLRRIFYGVVFLVVCMIFTAVCFGVFFRVDNIVFEGITRYTADEVSELLPFSKGDNLYSFSAASTEKLLQNNLPYVAEISVTRTLPSTVTVSVREKTPAMYIEAGGRYYSLSDDLHVLEASDSVPESASELIELKTQMLSRCIVGETLEFSDSLTLSAYTDLITAMHTRGVLEHITEITIDSRFDIYLNYEDRIEVYIGDTYNVDLKMRFLMGIMAELYENDRGYLDLSSAHEASFKPQ